MAVALANDAEKKIEGAKAEYVSRGRAVGVLLLELKQRYPNKPKEFEAKLTEVSGLQRSRAYDYMALAGGRKTEEGLREEARLRKEKERERKAKEKKEREQAEKAKPKPKPVPESVTVTDEAQPVFDSPQAAHASTLEPRATLALRMEQLLEEALTIANDRRSYPEIMTAAQHKIRDKAIKDLRRLRTELPFIIGFKKLPHRS
jgi:hypothetical protein